MNERMNEQTLVLKKSRTCLLKLNMIFYFSQINVICAPGSAKDTDPRHMGISPRFLGFFYLFYVSLLPTVSSAGGVGCNVAAHLN